MIISDKSDISVSRKLFPIPASLTYWELTVYIYIYIYYLNIYSYNNNTYCPITIES